METPLILERLYRLSPPKRARRRWLQRLRTRFVEWVRRHTSRLAIGSLVAAVWIVYHLHYYNVFVAEESNLQEAWAQVQATRQKRDHIQRDLTQLVRYYESYERDVLKQVTTLRTKPNAATVPETPQSLLARLDAVGEQYPNLGLDRRVQQFSELITDAEAEITDRIIAYNTAVNIYTTTYDSFPGVIFGRVLGFPTYDFYHPDDRSVLEYKEVKP